MATLKTCHNAVYMVHHYQQTMWWYTLVEAFARHYIFWVIRTTWIKIVYHDVQTKERTQLLLTGETFIPRQPANKVMSRLADIRARSFWGWQWRAFHPNTGSYHHTSIPALYQRHEQAKKRECGDRIRDVENALNLSLALFCHYWRHGQRSCILWTPFWPNCQLETKLLVAQVGVDMIYFIIFPLEICCDANIELCCFRKLHFWLTIHVSCFSSVMWNTCLILVWIISCIIN